MDTGNTPHVYHLGDLRSCCFQHIFAPNIWTIIAEMNNLRQVCACVCDGSIAIIDEEKNG